MCGIVGFNWDDRNLIVKMAGSIAHRGPDDHGYYNDKFVSLGHRRLSIIDLSAKGRQPMCNEDGSIWITYNGEIYNFKEIRAELEKQHHKFVSNTDTEVIIHAYEEYGEKCLHLFRGMFAFCIYDSVDKKLFLARDRLGIKPLYYYFDGKRFIFASEIKAILSQDELKREIDLAAFKEYLKYRYVFSEGTIFKQIKRLKPGFSLTLDLQTNDLAKVRYWDLDRNCPQVKDKQYAVEKLKCLFDAAVDEELISDVPLGVYLSGGLDSSAIVGIMRRMHPGSDIKTFSVGFNLDSNYDELKFARQVSDAFSTSHKELIVENGSIKVLPDLIWHMDEPLSDPAAIPNYLLSQSASKQVKVVLTGAGNDEVFAGYEHYKFFKLDPFFRLFPKSVTKAVLKTAISRPFADWTKQFFKYPAKVGSEGVNRYADYLKIKDDPAKKYAQIVSVFDDQELNRLVRPSIPDPMQKDLFFIGNQLDLRSILVRDIKEFLPEQVLMVNDKTAMASSLESRVPFVDHTIVEFSMQVPDKLKLHRLQEKFILKEVFRNTVPKAIINRKKQGFYVPIDNWFDKDLTYVFENLFSQDELAKEPLLSPQYIRKLIEGYNKSKLYYAKQLWSLINFEIWKKIYIENKSPNSLKNYF